MTDTSSNTLVNIEDEMKRSYMDYAMSVIIGRALPDVRDGLKPAHRRVLVRHAVDGALADSPLPQVREDRRRGDGEFPSPWRRVHLRHARSARARLQYAESAWSTGRETLDRSMVTLPRQCGIRKPAYSRLPNA